MEVESVKYTEHRTVTNKFLKSSASSKSGDFRVVRISVTDANATDSSSDEDENDYKRTTRVKRHVTEVRIGDHGSTPKAPGEEISSGVLKFRGVRQRPWGRFAAEIRDPTQRSRVWLGTYDTAEEAAMVYDKAAIRLKGARAITNFGSGQPKPIVVAGDLGSPNDVNLLSDNDSSCQAAIASPTSVLRFEPVNSEGVEPAKPVASCSNSSTGNWVEPESISFYDESFSNLELESFPATLFTDEATLPLAIPDDDLGDVLGDLNTDFGSFKWDVDNYYT